MHGAAFANYAVDDCDCLLALGARFDDRVAGNPAKFAGKAKFIAHLDIDASEINKVKRVDWSHVGLMADALLALLDYGKRTGFKRDWSEWHRHCDAAAVEVRHELRPRQRIDPALLRDRGDQSADPRRSHHHHRCGPASNVGGAVFRFPQSAAVADLGQHGHHGFRLAGGGGRAVSRSAAAWSSTSTAMPASA